MSHSDPAKRRAYQKGWLKRKRHSEHGPAVREMERRKRVKRLGAEGEGVGPEWEAEQLQRQCGRCAWCERDITQPIPERYGTRVGYDADHVVPLEQGGRHEAANLVLACPLCNARRGGEITPRGEKECESQ